MAQINGQTDNKMEENDFVPSDCWGKIIPKSEKRIKENLLELQQKIAPCKPRIIGVTKYYGLNAIINGYKAGLRDFGESRAVESSQKIESLPQEIRESSTFHFIGHLQSNKADKVVKYFDYIHSIDSIKVAKAVSMSAEKYGKTIKVLLQVNNAGEEQKFGYKPDELERELPLILTLNNLNLVGLMNMAPITTDIEYLTNLFVDLRNIRDKLESEFGVNMPELSMGMSDDYMYAVKAGATMIRIGRKLFNN